MIEVIGGARWSNSGSAVIITPSQPIEKFKFFGAKQLPDALGASFHQWWPLGNHVSEVLRWGVLGRLKEFGGTIRPYRVKEYLLFFGWPSCFLNDGVYGLQGWLGDLISFNFLFFYSLFFDR